MNELITLFSQPQARIRVSKTQIPGDTVELVGNNTPNSTPEPTSTPLGAPLLPSPPYSLPKSPFNGRSRLLLARQARLDMDDEPPIPFRRMRIRPNRIRSRHRHQRIHALLLLRPSHRRLLRHSRLTSDLPVTSLIPTRGRTRLAMDPLAVSQKKAEVGDREWMIWSRWRRDMRVGR